MSTLDKTTPVFWFSGMSGAGKSTIAEATRDRLIADGLDVLVLDGDVVREKRTRPLGFSAEDIHENLRLIAEHCKSVRHQHDIILVPVISPLQSARNLVRDILGGDVYMVHCQVPIAVLEERDPKGLYAKSRRGEMPDLVGYGPDAVPYEEPEHADIILNTADVSAEQDVAKLHAFISETFTKHPSSA